MHSSVRRVLRVFLGDTEVGIIGLIGSDTSRFSFSTDYREDIARPTLSQSFYANDRLVKRDYTSTLALPEFFSNLLPEGELRIYLANQNKVKPFREFFLLRALGEGLPGAVRVEEDQSFLDGSEDEDEGDAEKQSSASGSYMHEDRLKFSLAGVQLKFSALVNASGGLTIPTSGLGGDWVVKLPSAYYKNLPYNEYHMMDFARRIGIDVPETKLVSMEEIEGIPQNFLNNEQQALAVRRFDRSTNGDERTHVEDFAQVFSVYPEKKYDEYNYNSIARIINERCPIADLEEYIRRLVFNLAIGNSDMHLKNWSLIYRDTINPELSPAYDLVCTTAELEDPKIALRLGEKKNYIDITHHEFQNLAVEAGCPKHLVKKTVNQTVEKIISVWPGKRLEIQHLTRIVDRIDTNLKEVPVLRNAKVD